MFTVPKTWGWYKVPYFEHGQHLDPMIQVLNIMYLYLCDDLQYLLSANYNMTCNVFLLGLEIVH